MVKKSMEKLNFQKLVREIVDLIFDVEFTREIFEVLFPGITKEELLEIINSRKEKNTELNEEKVIRIAMFLAISKMQLELFKSVGENRESSKMLLN